MGKPLFTSSFVFSSLIKGSTQEFWFVAQIFDSEMFTITLYQCLYVYYTVIIYSTAFSKDTEAWREKRSGIGLDLPFKTQNLIVKSSSGVWNLVRLPHYKAINVRTYLHTVVVEFNTLKLTVYGQLLALIQDVKCSNILCKDEIYDKAFHSETKFDASLLLFPGINTHL